MRQIAAIMFPLKAPLRFSTTHIYYKVIYAMSIFLYAPNLCCALQPAKILL